MVDPMGPATSLQERTRGAAGARLLARSELQELQKTLGMIDFALVCRVIGAGHDIAGVEVPGGGKDHHAATESGRRYLAHRVRDALGVMAARFS